MGARRFGDCSSNPGWEAKRDASVWRGKRSRNQWNPENLAADLVTEHLKRVRDSSGIGEDGGAVNRRNKAESELA